jgi:hypothetical protein
LRHDVLGLDRRPGLGIDKRQFNRRSDFRSTKRTGGPWSPVTAHLSPTCSSACVMRALSLPLRVRMYS